MEKKLNINADCFFHSYVHHTFFHSIISSDTFVKNSVHHPIAEIRVKNFEKYDWKVKKEQINYEIKNKNLLFYSKTSTEQDMNIIFYRDLLEDDEIEIEIFSQLYSHPYASINLFCSNNKDFDEGEDLDSIDYGFRIGNFSKDGIYYSNGRFIHETLSSITDYPIHISITKKSQEFFISYRTQEKSECQKKFIFESNPITIGFSVNLKSNLYFEWLYSNYINIYYRPNHPIKFDFLVNNHKDYKSNMSNFFIDYFIESEEDICNQNIDSINFIRTKLLQNIYVETDINDNFHLHKYDSLQPFFHANLFYGFNDEKKIFYVIYFDKWRPTLGEINYSFINSEANYLKDRKFFTLKVNINKETFRLSKKFIKQQFMEFRNSKNISFYSYMYDKECTFGLKALEKLTSGRGLEFFTFDIRISRILLERSKLNLQRTNYLYESTIITEEKKNELQKLLNENIFLLEMSQNIILRRYLRNEEYSEEDMEHHYQNINRIFDNEKKITDNFINIL